MVRFVLLLVFVYVVARALRRFVAGIMDGIGAPGRRDVPSTNLVRDPVCGTFVVPSRALSAAKGPDVRFFCSNKCRQAWMSK